MRWLALAALLAARAAAAGEPDLLLETRVGERPLEMDAYLAHVARAAGGRALLHGAALGERVATRLGAVARDATDDEAQALYRAVKDGHDAYIRSDFGATIVTLERAAGELAARDGLLARDRRAREALERARLVLCNAYLRTGRPRDATAAMIEVIRAAPGREPSFRTFGPTILEFHRRVRQDLETQPRAAVRVVTRPEGAALFLGGEHVGLSPVRVAELHPGRYRLLARLGERAGRVHEIALASGTQEVALDLGLEAALAEDGSPALVYSDAESRGRLEVGHAVALGRALGAREVVIIGVGPEEGRPALRGAVISVDSARPVRAGFLTLEPAAPEPASLDAFGRFLRAGEAGPGVVVQLAGFTPPRGEPAPPRRTRLARLRWPALAAGVALAAAGSVLIALDGRGQCDAPAGVRCADRYRTLLPGAVLLGVGGAAAALAGAALLFGWGVEPRLAVTDHRPMIALGLTRGF